MYSVKSALSRIIPYEFMHNSGLVGTGIRAFIATLKGLEAIAHIMSIYSETFSDGQANCGLADLKYGNHFVLQGPGAECSRYYLWEYLKNYFILITAGSI